MGAGGLPRENIDGELYETVDILRHLGTSPRSTQPRARPPLNLTEGEESDSGIFTGLAPHKNARPLATRGAARARVMGVEGCRWLFQRAPFPRVVRV
jgi:hypothetical protein